MGRLSFWPAVLGLALAMIVITIVEPTRSSLAYASGIVVLLSLLGWILEARSVAGPPPAVEPEHEEEEEAPGPSYWPVILALSIVGIAAGIVYDWEYASLLLAVPLALVAAGAWGSTLKEEIEAAEPAIAPIDQIVGPGGRVLSPVSGQVLATQAAGGAAIAIERPETRQISRRNVLRISFWSGLGAGLLAFVGMIVDMLYPRGVTGFGGVVSAGNVSEHPPGTRIRYPEGRFWLLSLSAEQGGPGFLALWWKCPHLGCTVPYRDTYVFPDPATGQEKRGWFLCPCHGSTYNDAGVRVFGPAPRSMDRMALTIAPDGRISVNTGSVTKGTPDNASFAVKAP